MQVADPEQQHRVMIEAVENHMPQVGGCIRVCALGACARMSCSVWVCCARVCVCMYVCGAEGGGCGLGCTSGPSWAAEGSPKVGKVCVQAQSAAAWG
jgi:hypothetical protein